MIKIGKTLMSHHTASPLGMLRSSTGAECSSSLRRSLENSLETSMWIVIRVSLGNSMWASLGSSLLFSLRREFNDGQDWR